MEINGQREQVDFTDLGLIGSDALCWAKVALVAFRHPDTHEAFFHYLSNREDYADRSSGKGMAWSRKICEFLKLLIKLLMCAKKIGSTLLPPRIADQFNDLDRLQLKSTAMMSQLSR